MKTILVGGLGFIGKHLITDLTGSNEVLVLTDLEGLKRNRIFVESQRVAIRVGDITDRQKVETIFQDEKPAAVVHLAALTGLTRCDENPFLAFSINVMGTFNVVMGCVQQKSKLVFISSREVYGNSQSERTSEDGNLVPNNTYGLTKLLGERLVLWAASRHGLDYTILRLTNVYGPGGDQYNIQAMIRSAYDRGIIPIMGGGQRMNFVYVKDVAKIIGRCLNEPQTSRQIFNVGSYDDMTVEELVRMLIPHLGISVRTERKPMRSGETLSFRPDSSKIERALSYRPTNLADGLQETVTWYKDRLSQLPNN